MILDYRYITPLCSENDIEYAINLLVDSVEEENKLTQGIDKDGNLIPMDKETIKQTCLTAFGASAPRIANFLIVQDTFNRIYKDSILRYFTYAGINGVAVETVPYSNIQSLVMSSIIAGVPGIKPILALRPSLFEPIDDGNTIIRLLETTPLLSFQSAYIKLPIEEDNNMQEFVLKLLKRDILKKDENAFHIGLLPSCDFYFIQKFVELMHKYI